MEYAVGPSSWQRALRRAGSVLLPRRWGQRRPGWSLLVPVATACVGFLLTTVTLTANGTELRNDRKPGLKSLIAQRKQDVAQEDEKAAELRSHIEARTRSQAGSDASVHKQRSLAASRELAAGLIGLRGPGVTVRLDDAPRRSDGGRPLGATSDDLVVHQQDVQSVINALWAGGAEAAMIMGVRVISTSAVRCVGNTLLLDGRVYSPPFTVAAIGDSNSMQRALDASDGVKAFRAAAAAFGLGYQSRVETEISIPPYDGSTALRTARVPG